MKKVKQIKDKVILVRVNPDLNDRFRNHCINNGFSMSKRLRLLIEKDIASLNNDD